MKAGTHRRTRMPILVAAAVVLVALVNPVHDATARRGGGNGPKPKLVVKGLTVQDQDFRLPYLLIEEDGDAFVDLVFKVKNKGKTRSPKSRAAINFDGAVVSTKRFGPIDPGKTRTVRATFNAAPGDPGMYTVFVCVLDGNCTRDLVITAIPEKWNVIAFRRNDKTEAAPGMYFKFHSVVNEGSDQPSFWWLAYGTVLEDYNYDDGQCTTSGNGTVTHAPWGLETDITGHLEMYTNLRYYSARIEDDVYTYPAGEDCYNPDEPPDSYPLHMLDLRTTTPETGDIGVGYPPMEPTDRVLDGAEVYAQKTFSWYFTAAIP